MLVKPIKCPCCDGVKLIKAGKTSNEKQRFKCKNEACECDTFIEDYSYLGLLPETKKKIIEMAVNGSGIRDTARVLKVSPVTVITELKKEPFIESVNRAVLNTLDPKEVDVEIRKAEESEIDEMWSFVQKKEHQRWLWHAIDHKTGKVLAYVFGQRMDEVFLQLKELLEPFGINRFYTDNWECYRRHLDSDKHSIGKTFTQKIERKHLTLCTRIKRLVRKTICFSKTIQMHDIVIGLFVNMFEFELII